MIFSLRPKKMKKSPFLAPKTKRVVDDRQTETVKTFIDRVVCATMQQVFQVKKLKRQSQMLLDRLNKQTVCDVLTDVNDEPTDTAPDDTSSSQHSALINKINS